MSDAQTAPIDVPRSLAARQYMHPQGCSWALLKGPGQEPSATLKAAHAKLWQPQKRATLWPRVLIQAVCGLRWPLWASHTIPNLQING